MRIAAVPALAALLIGAAVSAGTPPAGFTDTLVAGTCCPTSIAFHPTTGQLWWLIRGDGTSNGTAYVRVLNGVTTVTALTLTGVDGTGERGLLGLAFDPDFATNPYVYLYYTAHDDDTGNVCTSGPESHNRVVRYTESSTRVLTGPVALLEGPPLTCASNHNAGAIHFGTDGKLYVAMGDNAASANAQNHAELRGKILRINRDGSIPTDNPYYGQAGWRNEIWALGLRNPFRFAVDPENGTLYIADVGQTLWEEVDLGVAGANYGWPSVEGPNPGGVAGMTYPTYSYGHSGTTPAGCSIIGGPVYRGTAFPADYRGNYYFSDFCGNWIYRAHLSPTGEIETVEPFVTASGNTVDIAEGPDGCLYYALNSGSIRRTCYVSGGNGAPTAVSSGTPTNGLAPLGVSFTGSASTDPDLDPLTYSWQFGDSGTSTSQNPVHSYVSNGVYSAALTVNDGTGTPNATDSAPPITVVVGNRAPTAAISSPADDSFYCAGQTIAYSGSGSDPEDDTLAASRFTWTISFHHASHVHPFLGPIAGTTGGSFTIPTAGEPAPDVWYQIDLDVRDSGSPLGASGVLTGSRSVEIHPRTAALTMESRPPGLQLSLNGQGFTAPRTTSRVCGFVETHGAPSPQTLGGLSYQLSAWSDRGSATHDVTNPSTAQSYRARYHCTPEASASALLLAKAGSQISASWTGTAGGCATGQWRIRSASTPIPTSGSGFFPDDPAFAVAATVSGTSTLLPSPVGDTYFLVTAIDANGAEGPSGSY